MTGTAEPTVARRSAPQLIRKTADGHELRVAVWPGDGERTLLLFNGIGSRLELVAPFVEQLDPAREVIAFDMPGIPANRPPPFLTPSLSIRSAILTKRCFGSGLTSLR